MLSEEHCNQTAARDRQDEHHRNVYQESIHCHNSNGCSEYSRQYNDADVCNQRSNGCLISGVTSTNDNVNYYFSTSAGAPEPLANSQAECLKQAAVDYLEILGLNAGDNYGACGSSAPSSCQASGRDQHDDAYLQLVASDLRYVMRCIFCIFVFIALYLLSYNYVFDVL
jgi:hypothetical protein